MKFIYTVTLLILLSCKNTPQFSTQVNCPKSNYSVLVLNADERQIREAIQREIRSRKISGTINKKYTAVVFKDKRSVGLSVSPLEAQYCQMIQVPKDYF